MSTKQAQRSRRSVAVVAGLCALFAAVTCALAFARYATLHNRTFDLALYARQAWGLVHVEAWDPIVGGDVLGGHLPWVLLPLGVLGALFGTVPVLLVAQSVCLALAAWPLCKLSAQRLGPLGTAFAALGWLLYPNLAHVATYEFHPGNLALWPMMQACCLLERDPRKDPRLGFRFALCCALVVACRVDLALQTIVLGVLCARHAPQLRRTGTLVALCSLLYFALWLFVLQPAHGSPATADLHFGIWGGSPLGVLSALIHDPARVFAHFTAPQRLAYPIYVLAPFAFLPLLAPRFVWPALPPIVLNLVSAFPAAAEVDSHYLTPALPPLAVGTVVAADALRRRLARAGIGPSRALVLSAWVLCAALGSVLAGGLPYSRDFHADEFRSDADTLGGRRVLARIPPGQSVQAPDRLLPHLAERWLVARQPPPEREAAFVALDVSHRRRFAHDEDLLRTIEEPLVRRWLARPDHQLLVAAHDLLLLGRGKSPRAGLVRRYFIGRAPPDSGKRLCACLGVRDAVLRGNRVGIELVARAPCSSDLALRLGSAGKPKRVDLLFDGLLSPVHLDRGDLLRSWHALSPVELAAIERHGLRVGALRSSGARPEPQDPTSVEVPLRSR